MARTRSIIIDNSLGRLFSGVAKVGLATQANVIGGAVQQTKSMSPLTSKTTVVPALNLGTGSGISIGANGGLVTSIKASVTVAPVNASLVITIKVGSSYGTSSSVATLTIASKTLTTTYTGNINIASGQSIYVDVTYSGTPTTRATGLSINFSNFPTTS